MKGIFPCKGSLILPKTEIEKLKDFYKSNIIENDTDNIYISNDYFNYFDNNTNIIFQDVTTLSVNELKNILGINKTPSENSNSIKNSSEEELIDDSSIANNPFFTTLKPIDN